MKKYDLQKPTLETIAAEVFANFDRELHINFKYIKTH